MYLWFTGSVIRLNYWRRIVNTASFLLKTPDFFDMHKRCLQRNLYKNACAWQKDSSIKVAADQRLKGKIITCKSVLVSKVIKSKANTHFSWLWMGSERNMSYIMKGTVSSCWFSVILMRKRTTWIHFYQARSSLQHSCHITKRGTYFFPASWHSRYWRLKIIQHRLDILQTVGQLNSDSIGRLIGY